MEAKTAEEQRALEQIAAVRAGEGCPNCLLGLLSERHALYADRNPADVTFLRGWILLAVAARGLTEKALPYVLEELESGTEPYLVGVAAHTLRTFPERRPAFAGLLLRAYNTIRGRDERLDFSAYGAVVRRPGEGTSAVQEIATSLAWLGGAAGDHLDALQAWLAAPNRPAVAEQLALAIARIEDEVPTAAAEARPSCCSMPRLEAADEGGSVEIADIELEDHAGRRLRFGEFFRGPSAAVFFYTRCDNAQKCPLTMTRLARLQRLLDKEGVEVRTAAITYDPDYDLPERLKNYGEIYGVTMADEHRVFRTPRDFAAVRRFFGLDVGYVDGVVNRHRVELYLLDGTTVVERSTRLQWDEAEVCARLKALRAGGADPTPG